MFSLETTEKWLKNDIWKVYNLNFNIKMTSEIWNFWKKKNIKILRNSQKQQQQQNAATFTKYFDKETISYLW